MEELKQVLNALESENIYLDGYSRIRSQERWYHTWTLRSCEESLLDEDFNRVPRLVDIELRADTNELSFDWNEASGLSATAISNIVKLANLLKEIYS